MTLVGKILVIIIMACSLLFLGFSTVVFTTATNWKDETTKQKQAVSELQTKAGDLEQQVEAAQKDLEAAKVAHADEAKKFQNQIATLESQITERQNEITQARTALETAQQTAKVAVDEASAATREITLLRSQNEAVRKQSDEFKLSKTELEDQVRELQRTLEVAQRNNADLLDRVQTYTSFLRSRGLTDNIQRVKAMVSGVAPPPDVEGQVKRVSGDGRTVEITIGSDDGLVVGHELNIYRIQPKTDYIGKIRILSVEPDQAVGTVVGGKTYQGKKIEEGDIVASTIGPRG